ncbi:MAG: dTMP kinase [Chloroflexia bacterium]
MRANPGPGKFIVLEGLDGAGTTTQVRRLEERLLGRAPVWTTREPSDGPAGRLIRRILAGEETFDPRALALLFAADRLDHLYGPGGVLEHLRRGIHVLCDRYYLSSLAYQTLDAPFSWVYAINRRALRPDLTVFLEVPVAECLVRIGGRQGERQELFERQEALEQVRARYYRAIEYLRRRETIVVVDGRPGVEEVAGAVWEAVQALLQPAGRE